MKNRKQIRGKAQWKKRANKRRNVMFAERAIFNRLFKARVVQQKMFNAGRRTA